MNSLSPNDPYCVKWDVKPYSTQLSRLSPFSFSFSLTKITLLWRHPFTPAGVFLWTLQGNLQRSPDPVYSC